MKYTRSKYSIGDMVIVNLGMIDPDFGQEICGWVGTVEKCRFIPEAGYIYTVRWSDETLEKNNVLKVSCNELGLDFETMQLLERDLSLYLSVRGKRFIRECLTLARRDRALSYAGFVFC
ncbi:hypothetical protein C9J03_08995 [Photobacterium gaetbulicola]|uniref:Uncharacterized protein n=1 Tax=Photobacterium gaetbulicola Gung47 TaxID=658445 RepID=A0A0C5WQZ4_9GAMM|nr:hypothetical protein [Photobacterium gaetbulicola]AJR05375.1 hypothetical protein H744_1c0350 [Photobacterium gaetbulicola Gung47]PSU12699.1 hypothetical protein C9J03_08995 [Photobacterium gaetbulicola]